MDFDISQVVITTVVVCLFLWRMSYGAKNGLFAELVNKQLIEEEKKK